MTGRIIDLIASGDLDNPKDRGEIAWQISAAISSDPDSYPERMRPVTEDGLHWVLLCRMPGDDTPHCDVLADKGQAARLFHQAADSGPYTAVLCIGVGPDWTSELAAWDVESGFTVPPHARLFRWGIDHEEVA